MYFTQFSNKLYMWLYLSKKSIPQVSTIVDGMCFALL